MKKTEQALKQTFKSSCTKTPQYIAFHRLFKKEIKKFLKPYTNRIRVSKPNHFDVTGFFELKNGKIFYFSIGDLRGDKSFLIRTADNFRDYTGGRNNFLSARNLEVELKRFVEKQI